VCYVIVTLLVTLMCCTSWNNKNIYTSIKTYVHVLHAMPTINLIEPSVFAMEKEELRIEVQFRLVLVF